MQLSVSRKERVGPLLALPLVFSWAEGAEDVDLARDPRRLRGQGLQGEPS